MSQSKRQPFLITYDISDKKRLRRVHRLLKTQALALQYSVFISLMNGAELEVLTEDILKIIDKRADDVRLYALPQKPEWYAWGENYWPEGININGLQLPSDH